MSPLSFKEGSLVRFGNYDECVERIKPQDYIRSTIKSIANFHKDKVYKITQIYRPGTMDAIYYRIQEIQTGWTGMYHATWFWSAESPIIL